MKIVQVVEYIEASHLVAEGTVVLAEDGHLYRFVWDESGPRWHYLPLPPLPEPPISVIDDGATRLVAGAITRKR